MASLKSILDRSAVVFGVVAVMAAGLLVWKCCFGPKLNFLPRDGRAEWIIFAVSVSAVAHREPARIRAKQDNATMTAQRGYAMMLRPNWDEPRRKLRINRARAIGNSGDARLLTTLAAAYGELGQFSEAIKIAEKASTLAHNGKDSELATRVDYVLESVRGQRPYRDTLLH